MRIVALEEHFIVPGLVEQIGAARIARRGYPVPPTLSPAIKARNEALKDVGDGRIADMDAAGITMQVLSLLSPASDLLPPEEAVLWAREANDILAATVAANPGRYAAFAHLPMPSPEAAAEELERTITKLGFCGALISGTCGGKFLDDPRFKPILAAAETLDVPLYIHPGLPPESVFQAYYGDLPGNANYLLATAGWGWHSETAIHILRLVLSGTLDEHHNLKLIVGHMGEGLPTMLARCDDVFNGDSCKYLRRGVSETILDQVWITTSGIFATPAFLAAFMAFGADRILFSVDYPFSANATGRAFVDALPVSISDKAKIAYGNADRLLKLKP